MSGDGSPGTEGCGAGDKDHREVRLATARLVLREFVPDDWPALHAIESRLDVAQFQSLDPRTEEESRASVAGIIAGAADTPRLVYDFPVVLPNEGRPIGRCGLGLSGSVPAEAVLWYTLHPSAWGKGYTTEAERALVDLGFRTLRLHCI